MDNKTKIEMLEKSINRMNIENENIRKKQEKQNAHIKMQEEKIEKYKKQIEELKKEDVVWEPQEGNIYFYVGRNGIIGFDEWDNASLDRVHYELGNCFKTKEEAEKAARHLRTRAKLQRIADKLNNREKNDLEKRGQAKWYIYYDCYDNEICADWVFKNKLQGTIYCLDKNFKDIAIKEIGEEELTAYLKGE